MVNRIGKCHGYQVLASMGYCNRVATKQVNYTWVCGNCFIVLVRRAGQAKLAEGTTGMSDG